MNWKDIETISLGLFPSPMHELKNLEKTVDGQAVWIKRDDITGLGFGGNKLRKLQYILKEVLDGGYTTLLTYGGMQTNHGRLTAATAAACGLKSVLLCYGTPPEQASGNLILDRMMGAEVVFMDTTEIRKLPREKMGPAYKKLMDDATSAVVKGYENRGEKVYVIPMGGHSSLGTLGYFTAIKEILNQSTEMGITFDYLVAPHGSGGTFAGLWLGAVYFKAPFEVVGVAVAPQAPDAKKPLSDFINKVSEEFNLGVSSTPEDLRIEGAYAGEGYNIPDAETRRWMYTLAREEALFVDPCYTGKGFRGMMEMIGSGIIPSGKKVLFLHTGGSPGIFSEEHAEAMQAELWAEKPAVYRYEG